MSANILSSDIVKNGCYERMSKKENRTTIEEKKIDTNYICLILFMRVTLNPLSFLAYDTRHANRGKGLA